VRNRWEFLRNSYIIIPPHTSDLSPLIRGPVVQLVRMPACHAGGRGFESLPDRHFRNLGYWPNGQSAENSLKKDIEYPGNKRV
jgi:hypothetical protein